MAVVETTVRLFTASFDNKVGELKRVGEKSISFEINEHLMRAISG